MLAKYVRPYAKGQKNDFNDAEAITEAVQRSMMKFVAVKTGDQRDLQALHCIRERLVSQRTAIINQIRAFPLERGVAPPRSSHPARRAAEQHFDHDDLLRSLRQQSAQFAHAAPAAGGR